MEWEPEPLEAMAKFLFDNARPDGVALKDWDWFKTAQSTRWHWMRIAAQAWETYWEHRERRETVPPHRPIPMRPGLRTGG